MRSGPVAHVTGNRFGDSVAYGKCECSEENEVSTLPTRSRMMPA